MPKLRLDVLHSLSLTAGFARELRRVEGLVLAGLVEEDVVREDVFVWNSESLGDGRDHLPEASGDEVHRLAVGPQGVEELGDTRGDLRLVVGEVRLHGLPCRLHHPQPLLERVAERDVAAHGFVGHLGHLVALAEEGGELVDALVGAHGAVDVEAHAGGGAEEVDDILGGFPVDVGVGKIFLAF